MKDLLTLVVPLLDRHHLTHRVLQNLDRQKCEFKIIVADGSVSKFEKERVKRGVFYENLDIEYMYNGHDFDINRYMNKMHNAFQKISTPFAMIFDNDDLIDLSGIRRGVYFMSNNLDYSTYRNDVRTLEFKQNYVEIADSLYTHPSIEQETSRERTVDCVNSFNSFNYAIFRTEQIKCFFEIMDYFDNNDFQLFSKSLAYFFASIGKCKRLFDESYYYFIPGNTILQTGNKIHKFREWMETNFWDNSSALMISIVAAISSHLHKQDIREDFAKSFIKEVKEKSGIINPTFTSTGESGGDSFGIEIPSDNIGLDRYIEKSKNFDKKIHKILNKYNFDDQKYSCVQSEPRTNEEFAQSLST